MKNIQLKLKGFIKKFYLNELVKGGILFFTLGLLYFILTLALEHFLWLSGPSRMLLFWLFILAECALLYHYVLIPLSKLKGLKKGISETDASKIIGAHFPEVSDKLLNLLQLKNSAENSELIAASITQKSKQLSPVTFKHAIDLKKNKKYIKFALIPLVILLLLEITTKGSFLVKSYDRVVHYNTPYEPPAPFIFYLENELLNVIEGEGLNIHVKAIGDVQPNEARIHMNGESYYMDHMGSGEFEYYFQSINSSLEFHVSSNGIYSRKFVINCIPTPVVTNLKMVLKYPEYTGKRAEVIQNTGNATVPEGAEISWQIETDKVEELILITDKMDSLRFNQNSADYFSLTEVLLQSMQYQINTSNAYLKAHEQLPFKIAVIKDKHPKISVDSAMDTLLFGPAEFSGQLSDDYGLRRLQLVYYDLNNSDSKKTLDIPINRSLLSDFYYIFPDGALVDEGKEYGLYFEVFDNDGVNGSKKTKSRVFQYYQPTPDELQGALLEEQAGTMEDIDESVKEFEDVREEMNRFVEEIQKKADINWNDSQKLEEFIERQERYEEMFKRQTDKLQQNLNSLPTNEKTSSQKEELQKRIEEAKELAEREKLLNKLDSLANRMERENMLDKLEEMTQRNKQNKQSLERLLELTKRFYVEQKMNLISDKLLELSQKENELSESDKELNDSTRLAQEEIRSDFDELKKELQELEKENSALQRPMNTPDHEDAVQDIEEELDKAAEEIEQNENEKSKKTQKSAAKKMKKLGEQFEQQMMQMDGEELNENIDDLRKIVENLIEYSFLQEELLVKFESSTNDHPEYPNNLKKQQVLKEYFEHIDDSLYVLSLRVESMSVNIQKEVNDVHYNMESSLKNFADNRFAQGISNQHYMITGTNNLANMLSDLLENMMNASMSMGKGSGDQEFKLPDIIQKQGELQEKMQEGKEQNEQGEESEQSESGEGQGDEEMNGELFEIYKEQVKLREALEEMLGEEGKLGESGEKAVKEMEDLEQELLEKGFTQDVIERMQEIEYELLKLQTAKKEQGKDTKREATEGRQTNMERAIQALKLKRKNLKEKEKLLRQSLPLRTIYKERVEDYFNKQKEKGQ